MFLSRIFKEADVYKNKSKKLPTLFQIMEWTTPVHIFVLFPTAQLILNLFVHCANEHYVAQCHQLFFGASD